MNEQEQSIFNRCDTVIKEDIKPYIEADGGFITLIEVEDKSVFVELGGACAHCPGAAMTLKGGVERILKMKVPEVEMVRLAM
ncbi:MAG: NifU family protein [Candidatus Kapabacteria bacterium]|nr:NifU family protein [Candidatus Kapabacteria bacterium]